MSRNYTGCKTITFIFNKIFKEFGQLFKKKCVAIIREKGENVFLRVHLPLNINTFLQFFS